MPKNCLLEYLTPECPDWADGSGDMGIGCATHQPIMLCPHFAKMCEEEEIKRRKCKNCGLRDKKTKICTIRGQHTARKNSCADFVYRW